MKIVALIPARGGSKGIPCKNIKLFRGYPLLTWSIKDGLAAGLQTVVSTDDKEIAEIAAHYGAEILMRPPELAEDLTPDLPVFQHFLEHYEADIIVHLRPTAPIRPPSIIQEALRILAEHPNADSVRGVTVAHQTPYKMWNLESGKIVPFSWKYCNAPRQTIPVAYAHTGLIDVIRSATIRLGSMTGQVVYPVFYSQEYHIDLDTMADWIRHDIHNC